MYLNELEENAEIMIRATDGERQVDLYSNVIRTGVTKSGRIYAMVTASEWEDKIVNMNCPDKSFTIYLHKDKEEKCVSWPNVTLVYMRKPERMYVIICMAESVMATRRGAFRVPVYSPCTLSSPFFNGEGKVTGRMRDISATGIAFTFPRIEGLDPEKVKGEKFTIVFKDDENGENFKLRAVCIRTMEMENGEILAGCRLTRSSTMVSGYINRKQAHRLKIYG